MYDNIEDNHRHFVDNFRKSVISMSYTLDANGKGIQRNYISRQFS